MRRRKFLSNFGLSLSLRGVCTTTELSLLRRVIFPVFLGAKYGQPFKGRPDHDCTWPEWVYWRHFCFGMWVKVWRVWNIAECCRHQSEYQIHSYHKDPICHVIYWVAKDLLFLKTLPQIMLTNLCYLGPVWVQPRHHVTLIIEMADLQSDLCGSGSVFWICFESTALIDSSIRLNKLSLSFSVKLCPGDGCCWCTVLQVANYFLKYKVIWRP